jgi:hypothetical protein
VRPAPRSNNRISEATAANAKEALARKVRTLAF